MMSTNGFHIGFPETMRECSRWICNHIETLGKVCLTTNAMFYAQHRIDFPSRVFIEHLFEITQTRSQQLHPKVSSTQPIVPTSSITSAVDSFNEAMRRQHMKLLQTLNFIVRRSPKRRLGSIAPSEQGR